MNSEDKKAFYLAEMRKAEDLAAKAPSAALRDHWLRIAEGYRHLVDAADKKL